MNASYTLVHALFGGVLIGLASFLAAVSSGRIPGLSGMVSRVLRPRSGDTAWRVVFLVGLLAGAAGAMAALEPAAVYRPVRPLAVMALAGLLVGAGTRIGGGCTSGHGVCGIGLGSRTALVATVVFIGTAMLTVLILHQGLAEGGVRS